MPPHTDPEAFANEWIASWNSHNLDRVMAHYAKTVEFTSPFVVKLTGEANGTLYGKSSVRIYFERALTAYPTLRFELLQVLVGVNSVTLYYRSVQNIAAAEVMLFDAQGQVERVIAHYATNSG